MDQRRVARRARDCGSGVDEVLPQLPGNGNPGRGIRGGRQFEIEDAAARADVTDAVPETVLIDLPPDRVRLADPADVVVAVFDRGQQARHERGLIVADAIPTHHQHVRKRLHARLFNGCKAHIRMRLRRGGQLRPVSGCDRRHQRGIAQRTGSQDGVAGGDTPERQPLFRGEIFHRLDRELRGLRRRIFRRHEQHVRFSGRRGGRDGRLGRRGGGRGRRFLRASRKRCGDERSEEEFFQ